MSGVIPLRTHDGRPYPRGYRVNNPGNIDHNPANQWRGLHDPPIEPRQLDGSRPRFCWFTSPVFGIRAIAILLRNYQRSTSANGTPVDTIAEIVAKWAPAVENNVAAYVQQVDKAHPKTAWDVLDMTSYADVEPLVQAIIRHELGDPRQFGLERWYPQEVVDKGLEMSGVLRPAPTNIVQAARQSREFAAQSGQVALGTAALGASLAQAKELVDPGTPIATVIACAVIAVGVYGAWRAYRRRTATRERRPEETVDNA